MTQDAIVISYDPFAAESRVNIFKNGIQKNIQVHSNIDDLVSEIIATAYGEGIFNVKAHAPFAFTSEIAKRVHEQEKNKFSAQKIKVEGL